MSAAAPLIAPEVEAEFLASADAVPVWVLAYLADTALGEVGLTVPEFNEEAGGGHFTSFAGFPNWAGIHHVVGGKVYLSKGAGEEQDEKGTWAKIVAATHVPDFSPRSQLIGNAWWAGEVYHEGCGRVLLTDLKAGIMAPAGRHALASQWGRGVVAGPPGAIYKALLALFEAKLAA